MAGISNSWYLLASLKWFSKTVFRWNSFILSWSLLVKCRLVNVCVYLLHVFSSARPPRTPTHKQTLASDGRLYRCELAPGLSNGALRADEPEDPDEDWEEREASRTHSVKFVDAQEQDNREVSSTTSSATASSARRLAVWWRTFFDTLWERLTDCVSKTVLRSDSYNMLPAG